MDGQKSKSNIITSLVLGTSLFGGFVSGLNFHWFQTETINFKNISWISNQKTLDFKIADLNSVDAQIASKLASTEIEFVPYEFTPFTRHLYAKASQPDNLNFFKLEKAYESVEKAARTEEYADFQSASFRFRNEFAVAMKESPVETSHESIAMTSSSAETVPEENEKFPLTLTEHANTQAVTPKPEAAVLDKDDSEDEVARTPKSYEEEAAIADLEISKDPLVAALESISKEKTVAPVQKQVAAPTKSSTPVEPVETSPDRQIAKADRPLLAENAPEEKTEPSKESRNNLLATSFPDDVPVVTVDPANAAKMMALLNSQGVATQGTIAQAAPSKSVPQSKGNPITQAMNKTPPTSGNLAENEKKNLADALINTQLKNASAKQNDLPADVIDTDDEGDAVDETPLVKAPLVTVNSCHNVTTQQFIKAGGASASDVATQVCPTNLTWISKSGTSSAWLKVEGEGYFPTVTLEPAPNHGSTLLLDTNALGLLSIKSGIHVTKGMGIILGTVPEGYKVNFAGRAEETEYFESTGIKYFAILNAEPGAGIVEIASKTIPNLNSTVFAPVLGDTITYLDLAAPKPQTLKIKVVKNGGASDPEVSKLSVSLSTQSGLQAITREDGQATLNDVNLVPGFPVFIDVTSRNDELSSFTYRYEIKHPESGKVFLANEVQEKSIHRWLKQVGTGLSDQSAMVVGLYDRKKLNGFKRFHYSQVEPLSAKFGLEPMNYSVLWNGSISDTEPLEGDLPRFMSVQVPEGLSNIKLLNETHELEASELFPISPRVIHVIAN